MARLYTFDVEAYLQNNTHVYLGKQEIYVPEFVATPHINNDVNITGNFNYLSDCFPSPYENILFGAKTFQWSNCVNINSIIKQYVPLGELKYEINSSAISYLSFSSNGYVANVFNTRLVYLYGDGFNGNIISNITGWSIPANNYSASNIQYSEFFAIKTNDGIITELCGMGVAVRENINVFSRFENYSGGFNKLIEWFNALEFKQVSNDPYTLGGESETGGGTGDFDGTSDPIDFPPLPTISATDTGFISLFNPSLAELQSLAAYMWNTSLFDITNFQKLFADPMDAILGLSIVPVSIPNAGTQVIKVGNITTNVNMNKAAAQYIEVDCGTLNVNEFWGAYLDYAPYTKAEIYLPYCGTHAIDIDDVMNKSVHVKYHIDILSGACCAYVKCDDSVLYQFSGQCASSIPISGADFVHMVNGVLSAAVSVGSMVATGGASAPLAIPALANTAANGGLKPSIEKSGAISGTSGMLAIQKPYMILTRPKQALPANQNHFTGYPSFITETLGNLSGYTEIEKIHLEGVPATDDELTEIETLLKGGVIL